ncbi:MAG: TIGR03118 family protein [Acidobacteriota bacterium]
MPTRRIVASWPICAMTALLLVPTFAYANQSDRSGQNPPNKFGGRYEVTELISDIEGLAVHTDENLVNAWGITHSATSPWWINAAGTALSLVKNGAGEPFPTASPLIVSIPGAEGPAEPTGIVFNNVGGFEVASGFPAVFIFASTDGTISAWNPNVKATEAVVKVTNPDGAYFGVTIASDAGTNYLYAANFLAGTIDVFDSGFQSVDLGPNAFKDDELPEDFAPFNVQNIGGTVYVMYAKREEDEAEEVTGKRLGFVDAYSPSGVLQMRLQHGPWMNAPWGIALAPDDFGRFSNDLLVGMFGSGQIAAFNPDTGRFIGILKGKHGPISIDGLWGIGFGNDGNAGPSTTLFFAAGIEDEEHGLFGTITPLTKENGTEKERSERSQR